MYFGVNGASELGVNEVGNGLLKLNKNYPLGYKGEVIQLPKDRWIYRNVRSRGEWEFNESEFLSNGLAKAQRNPLNAVALLDIGANCGLVTLQILNLSAIGFDVFCFEPIKSHAKAIEHNLKKYQNISIHQVALGAENGHSKIYTEASNRGNSSLFKSVVPEGQVSESEIAIASTEEFCREYLLDYNSFVIKCDTQGMDALILSRIVPKIWENVECAVIEIWALPEINILDVRNLMILWSGAFSFSWESQFSATVNIEEISDFWLSKNSESKNLFLKRFEDKAL
jgi:FkbM family methyltransferase